MNNKEHFSQQSQMPLSAADLFAWHKRPGAFERLSPPWVDMKVLERTGGIEEGARVVLEIKQGPVALRWTLEHTDFEDGHQFKDYQVSGPFVSWVQLHACEPIDDNSSFLKDLVTYELPLHMVSRAFGVPMIQHELRRLFRYRHRLMLKDCESVRRYSNLPFGLDGVPRKRVLVTGSTGLVGRHLVPFLWTQNCEVVRLKRPTSDHSEVVRTFPNPEPVAIWEPSSGFMESSVLENIDCVVHLSGDNLARGRWDEAKKERLRESRMSSTRLLVETILNMKNRPSAFLGASAIGFYGNRDEQLVDETKQVGSGFLAHLCEEWESITEPLKQAGVRVVNLRIGVVLSPRGGALGAMLPIFQAGGGGPIGSGNQYLSWISPDDLSNGIFHCIVTDSVSGPVNLVAPNPVRNKIFAETLAHVLFRPAFMPLPAFAARAIFGEFADEALLSGARVLPKKLVDSGYIFRDPDLETALRSQLGA
ncbi:MAG TPA: TIGR01777 family oxidoreductase [Oculatellaceae cyanobacterium]